MQDARYCSAFVTVQDEGYAAFMASELNNAFIPGVGTVQAEVARPRNRPLVGTTCKAGQPKLVPMPPKHPPPAHLLRAAVPKMQAAPMDFAFLPPPGVSVSPKAAGAGLMESVMPKAAGAAPMESVMPKAGAPMESVMPGAAMESVMPEAGAAMESVMPEAAPMESVLPDLLEDGYGDDDEAEEIGDDELHRFFAENAATSPASEEEDRSRSTSSLSSSRSRTRSRSRRRRSRSRRRRSRGRRRRSSRGRRRRRDRSRRRS